MGTEFFQIGEDGVQLKVWVGVEPLDAVLLSLAMFLAIFLALALYAKIN